MSIEYRPLTGVGRFNAELATDTLRIKHRLSLVSNQAAPVTDDDVQQFETAFQTLITGHWTQKYMFSRQGRNVRPTFTLEFLDEAQRANAHYVVNLSQSAGGSENVGRDAHHKFTALGENAPRTTSFMTGTVLQPTSATLIANDLPRVFPYYIDYFAGVVSAQTKAHVEHLMKQVARLNPQPRLYVTAYGANATANRRAAVALLANCGLANVEKRNSGKIFVTSQSKMSGRTEYVKISVKDALDTQSILNNTPVHSYPATIVHEYGHMLGLQDEYHCMGQRAAHQLVKLRLIDAGEQQKYENFHFAGATVPSERVEKGQKAFVKACHRANVDVPAFGSHTTSIMSAGADFLPAHFVWLREALVQITGEDDWAIVPHA